MKRTLSAVLVIVLLLGCLAGCKDTAGATDDTQATTGTESNVTVNPNGLSLEEDGITYDSLAQKAVVKTALAYLARGTRIQYDDSRMNPKGAPESAGILYRWQCGARKSPEEYTSQYTGYTNCAAFTSEVYLAALGCSVEYTTANLASIKSERRAYRYAPTGKETAEEMAAVQAEFLGTLKMGDIIVVRRHNGTGHAMLYVGSKVLEGVEGYKGAASEGTNEDGIPNDSGYVYDIIHSTGSSYNYSQQVEKYEKYGSIQITAANSLFDSKSGSYVFGKLTSLTIIRPLNTFKKDVPESSLNRLQYMDNVVAEKVSSHLQGNTVNPGENITYQFSVANKNDTPVTVEVKDTIPANTALVSAENATVDGANIRWELTVPANSTAVAEYVVSVNTSVQSGDLVTSDAGTVGGISVKCPSVYVGRTLKEAEQAALLADVDTQLANGLRGMELANALYNNALNNVNLLKEDLSVILNTTFRNTGEYFYLAWDGIYKDMVAPGMFGGRNVPQRDMTVSRAPMIKRQEERRARDLRLEYLVVGDIVMVADDKEGTGRHLYMVTDAGLLNLMTGTKLTTSASTDLLMSLYSTNRFAVLRPSLLLGTD